MNFRQSILAARVSGPDLSAAGTIQLVFCFPANDPTFTGHFPTRPLLPGVFQLEIARLAAELALHQPLQICEIIKAKFLRPIIPDETLRVELKFSEKPDTIDIRAHFSVTGQAAGEALLRVARKHETT